MLPINKQDRLRIIKDCLAECRKDFIEATVHDGNLMIRDYLSPEDIQLKLKWIFEPNGLAFTPDHSTKEGHITILHGKLRIHKTSHE